VVSAAVAPLLEATRIVPIVFAGIADPVAAGYVESLSRPGGNATGFSVYEYSMSGKWLEVLKEVVPRVTRAAVLRPSDIAAGPGQFGTIQALAPSLGVELRPINVRDAAEIERALAEFARRPNGDLIVFGSPGATIHLDFHACLLLHPLWAGKQTPRGLAEMR
jgi:putative ABC transport system substrate-binding protein